MDGFLEAFHGLRPWDEFPLTPDWYTALLLPGMSPPPQRMLRDAPSRKVSSKPATAAAVQPRPIPDGEAELHVEILYEGAGLPDLALVRKRNVLEEWIEAEGLGEVTDAGGGGGVLDVYVNARQARSAAAAIEQKLLELGWGGISSVEVMSSEQ